MKISTIELLGIFLATVLITSLTTPLVRRIAYARDITDKPDGLKKVQHKPVAYLGGVAVAVGFSIAVLLAAVIGQTNGNDWVLLVGILAPALAMALVGLMDDLLGLGVYSRFISQSIAALFTSFIAYQVTDTRPTLLEGTLNFVIVVLWVVGVTNAINLLDNMNGLATGSSALSGLFFAFLALISSQYLVSGFAFALAASCIGFLFFNFPKATIYLGDAGALFLGFLLAVIALRLNLNVAALWESVAIKLAILALPITDTATVIISRLRREVSPFQGGRDHLSHRLLNRGISPLGAALTLFSFQGAISLAAVFFYFGVRI